MATLYVSIGNSDDKLPQSEWSQFQTSFIEAVAEAADEVHGVWFSSPIGQWQNACVCADIADSSREALRARLADLAAIYRQESIAWAAVTETEFIHGNR